MQSTTFLLAVLFLPAWADQTCYSGTLKGPDGKEFSKGDFVQLAGSLVTATVMKFYHHNSMLKQFLDTRGQCQHDCTDTMIPAALEVLYGKLGQDVMSNDPEIKALAVQSLTGAFRACYPSPPRAEVLEFMTKVVADVGKVPPSSNPADVPAAVVCPNKDNIADFHVNEFEEDFEAALLKMIKSTPEAKEFFDNVAKDCQMDCLHKTIPMSAKTMFMAGIDDEAKAKDAMTGAIKACYPGLDVEIVRTLVAGAAKVMDDQSSSARLRLYNTKMLKPLNALGFLPLCGIAAALSLSLFMAGIAVGRRMQKQKSGVVCEVHDVETDARTIQGLLADEGLE